MMIFTSSKSQLKSDSNVSFPCDITGKDSLSAIKRASSIQCKQEILDLICAIERGEVYPKQLPRYCQSKIDVLKVHVVRWGICALPSHPVVSLANCRQYSNYRVA